MKRDRSESSASVGATPSTRPRLSPPDTYEPSPDEPRGSLQPGPPLVTPSVTQADSPSSSEAQSSLVESLPASDSHTPPSAASPSDNNDEDLEQWGFVVYRTTYGDDLAWEEMKAKLAAVTTSERETIEEEGADADGAMLEYIEDETTMKDAKSQQIRRIFNPLYDPTNEDREPPPFRSDNLCAHVCLMIDAPSMTSIINHTEETPGFVIAIDANNEKSEQCRSIIDEDGVEKLSEVPWDGTMKVDIRSIFSEFYVRNVGEDALTMGEIHPDMGQIWRW